MVIQILSTLDESICANCGGAISLLQGDLERTPRWSHNENGYAFCPGSPTARPATEGQPARAAETLTDEELAALGFRTPGSGGLLRERIESILAARTAQARALRERMEAVCAEWDADPSLPPSTYNFVDYLRAALAETDRP